MTKPPQKQRTFTRSNFAEHKYNYVNISQTSKPPRKNPQNRSFLQRQNFQQQTSKSNLVNFNDNPRNSTDPSENYPFFQQNNCKQPYQNKQKAPYYTPNYLSSDDDDHYQPDIFAPYTQEYRAKPLRPNQASQKTKFYPQNLANTQKSSTVANA